MNEAQRVYVIEAERAVPSGIPIDDVIGYLRLCLNAGKFLRAAPCVVPVLPRISRSHSAYAAEKKRILFVLEAIFDHLLTLEEPDGQR